MANMDAMLRGHAVRYAANLFRSGRARRDVRRALHLRFPNSADQSVEGVINRARAAMEAADLLRSKGTDERLMAKETRAPDRGCTLWRYYYAIQYTDTGTGRTGTVSSQYTSDTSISIGALTEIAMAEFDAQKSASLQRRFSKQLSVNDVLTSVHLLTVERACP